MSERLEGGFSFVVKDVDGRRGQHTEEALSNEGKLAEAQHNMRS